MDEPFGPASDARRDVVERLLSDRAWLRALARSLVVDDATADDLAQDAAVVALTKPPGRAEALRAWLRRVASNLASNRRRGTARREARDTAPRETRPSDDPHDVVAAWETRRAVVDAVLALEPPYRETILLAFFEERSAEEIAAIHGVSAEAVKSRRRRAIEMLRGRLAHLDDGSGRRGMAVLLVLADRALDPVGPPGPHPFAAPLAAGVVMNTVAKVAAAGVLVATVAAGVWIAVVREPDPRQAAALAAASDRAADRARAARAKASEPTNGDAAQAGVAAGAPRPADADPDTEVTGIVVDASGAPRADARVELAEQDEVRAIVRIVATGAAPRSAPVASATSRADGTFRMRVARGSSLALRASADGAATWESSGVQPGDHLRIVLGPPATFRVIVRGADATSVAGARVAVVGFERSASMIVARSGTTGDDGSVAWSDVPRIAGVRGEIEVRLGDDRFPSRARFELTGASEQDVEVAVAAGAPVRGLVLDAVSGQPVRLAEVRLDRIGAPVARSAPDGTFGLDGWTGDGGSRSSIVVSAPGYAAERVRIPATPPSSLDIRLTRGFDVTGTAVGPDGAPIADAFVLLVPTGDERHVPDAATGADGAFRIGAADPRQMSLVAIRAPGFADAIVSVRPPEPGQDVVALGEVRLTGGRSVRGVVVDAQGAPAAGRRIRLEPIGAPAGMLAKHRRSGARGTFEFPGTAPGRWRVSLADAASAPVPSADVTVPADADPETVTLSLARPADAPANHVARVVVTDRDGRPVPNVKLMAGGPNLDVRATSGADGSTEFRSSHELQYVGAWLDAEQAKRYLNPWRLLRPGETDVSLVLEPAEAIEGRVLAADGSPAAGVWVRAMLGAQQVGAGSTTQDGTFAFGVPPGSSVDLIAEPSRSEADASAAEQAQVRAGATGVELRIRPVETDRTLEVYVDGLAPTSNGVVTWHYTGLERGIDASTATKDGRARIPGLPRKSMELRIRVQWDASDWNGFLQFAAPRIDAARTTLRVAVPQVRTIRGVVTDESGAVRPGAHLFVATQAFQAGDTARDDGTFALRVPQDATLPFQVHATPAAPDETEPRAGFCLVESFDEELRIVLRPAPRRR